MRVAMILPGGVDRSGTHRVIPCYLWLLERLTGVHGHEVEVFAMRGEEEPGRWSLHGATVHNVGRGRVLDSATVRTLRALVSAHRRRPFDVVHAAWASGPGVVAALARPWVSAPILLHVAGGDLVRLPEIGYGGRVDVRGRALVALALAAATERTAASGTMLDRAEAMGRPAHRVPLGVSLDAWPPRPPRPRRPGAPARLVAVGTMNRVKDHATLLRAFADVVGRGVDARLELVGGDTLAGAIPRMADDLGLSGRVRFHGYLPQTELRPVVESADLLVHSSRHESGPLVVLEAAVVGVPTVATAVGHPADWAPDAAVVAPPGDAVALADGVAGLLGDEERRLAVAAAARERAMARDADWTAAEYDRLYHTITGGSREGEDGQA